MELLTKTKEATSKIKLARKNEKKDKIYRKEGEKRKKSL